MEIIMNNIAVIPNELRDADLKETQKVINVLNGYGAKVFVEQRF